MSKTPPKKTTKKAAAKKAPAKKKTAQKAVAKKATSKKAVAKKATTKKAAKTKTSATPKKTEAINISIIDPIIEQQETLELIKAVTAPEKKKGLTSKVKSIFKKKPKTVWR
jgi:predicted lipoprotein